MAKVKSSKERVSGIPLKIIAAGAMNMQGVMDGRMIPALIVDSFMNREVLNETVRMHRHLHEGEARVQWGSPLAQAKRDKVLTLRLHFTRPIENIFLIDFSLPDQAGLVDMVLQSNAVYLQPGLPGDRLSNTTGENRLLLEVPKTGFEEKWKAMVRRSITKDVRRRGLRGRDAKHAAGELIDEWRRLTDFRLK